MSRAVVFAYHEVGVRCLKVLLAHGVEVALVVTHEDNPAERIWFGSVAATAREHGLPVIAPADANDEATFAAVTACHPDFLFSFYFRQMLATRLLEAAPRGAYNMHGSLLPRYRGRVPVNWAVLHGERRTGATLHRMEARPDRGAIVSQQAVPILPDDTAGEVFAKVTVAAEIALDACLPALLAGTAPHHDQDPAQASYFGGRRPEDGRIDWSQPAERIHDLVRAVAPPYPGAFAAFDGATIRVLRTLRAQPSSLAVQTVPAGAGLFVADDALWLRAADGGLLRVLDAEFEQAALDARRFVERFGRSLRARDGASPSSPIPNAASAGTSR
jgi:methionyl-tRNA formyltransferase